MCIPYTTIFCVCDNSHVSGIMAPHIRFHYPLLGSTHRHNNFICSSTTDLIHIIILRRVVRHYPAPLCMRISFEHPRSRVLSYLSWERLPCSVVPAPSALHSTDGRPHLTAITAYLPSLAKRTVIISCKQILHTLYQRLISEKWDYVIQLVEVAREWRRHCVAKQKTEFFLLPCHIDHSIIISTPPVRNMTSQRLTKKPHYITLWVRYVECILSSVLIVTLAPCILIMILNFMTYKWNLLLQATPHCIFLLMELSFSRSSIFLHIVG